MDNLKKLLGNRLREVRKAKGLRQEDLEKFGISYKYYQRIEGGKVNLTLETIEKIAKALGIDATELFIFPMSKSKEANELCSLIRKYAGQAGLPQGVRPHTARATFITQALERKCPIEAVQRSVGHSRLSTTQMYDKREVHHRESASFVVQY